MEFENEKPRASRAVWPSATIPQCKCARQRNSLQSRRFTEVLVNTHEKHMRYYSLRDLSERRARTHKTSTNTCWIFILATTVKFLERNVHEISLNLSRLDGSFTALFSSFWLFSSKFFSVACVRETNATSTVCRRFEKPSLKLLNPINILNRFYWEMGIQLQFLRAKISRTFLIFQIHHERVLHRVWRLTIWFLLVEPRSLGRTWQSLRFVFPAMCPTGTRDQVPKSTHIHPTAWLHSTWLL